MSDDFDNELSIPLRWDRNYSTNYSPTGGVYVYEVVNELTNPVLQVCYTSPNEIHINGIFKIDTDSVLASFGQQPQLITFTNRTASGLGFTQEITTVSLKSENFLEILSVPTNGLSTGQMITNEFYRPIFTGQRPIFKYPSNRYLGAFQDGFTN